MKILLILLISSLCAGPALAAGTPNAAFFGQTLIDSQGRPVSLGAFQGKPLIVNFWARWCQPCREEIPELVALQKRHGGRLQVIGIALEDDPGAMRGFIEQYRINYPILLAGRQGIDLMKAFGNPVGGLPFSVYLDHRGELLETKLGKLHAQDLKRAEQRLLRP